MPESELITAPEQATAGWLTAVLRRGGCLPRGRVTAVTRSGTEATSIWTLYHLQVAYSVDARDPGGEGGGLPPHLLLKLSNSQRTSVHHGLGSGMEVWFYRHIASAPEMARVPLARCYAAGHELPHGAAYALVEDLSYTHWQPPLALPPFEPLCAQAIECLAALHAAWWGHGRLGPGGDVAEYLARVREAAGQAGLADPLERLVPAFLDFLGDRLAPERRRLYEGALATWPALQQHDSPRTLLHGDAHWWNFLYARDPAADTTRIVDWGSWGIGAPMYDLAYAIALQWYPERRRRLEARLVRRYHDALRRAGVAGYPWGACWTEYRLAVARGLFTPVRFWAVNVPAYIWWPMLERAVLAYEDLGCAGLSGAPAG